MRLLAVVVVVGLLTLPAGGSQKRASDCEREGLKGRVRSVSVDIAPLEWKRGKWVAGVPVKELVDRFDARGDRVETIRFAGGDVVERTSYRYMPDGAQESRSELKTSGSVFTLVSLDTGTPNSPSSWRTDRHIVRFEYDDEGARVAGVEFDEAGDGFDPRCRETYDYDEAGRVVGDPHEWPRTRKTFSRSRDSSIGLAVCRRRWRSGRATAIFVVRWPTINTHAIRPATGSRGARSSQTSNGSETSRACDAARSPTSTRRRSRLAGIDRRTDRLRRLAKANPAVARPEVAVARRGGGLGSSRNG